jgi:ribosomal protein S18 acetylase RimI-like enzyme
MENIKIREVSYKEVPFNLLLLADPSKKAIKKYLKNGTCFVALENNEIVGVYILARINKDAVEIVNIAVAKKNQNKGIGKMLVRDAIRRSKNENIKMILVGTGNSSIGQIAFYQKCGFKIVGIKKNFFVKRYRKPIFENGIQCKDMIRLELVLNH